jgi:TPR repeat protein
MSVGHRDADFAGSLTRRSASKYVLAQAQAHHRLTIYMRPPTITTIMRTVSLVISATVLMLASALAQGPSPSGAAPSSRVSTYAKPSSTAILDTPYLDLVQGIARRADPLDTADVREIERRALAGSREDQLAMGSLLTLGTAAQVTSPQVPTANPVKAAEYFEMAARSGSPEAQFLLGIMNLRGTGIPADRVKGATWINVASAANFKLATKEARRLKSELSRDEMAEAQRRANEWLSRRGLAAK